MGLSLVVAGAAVLVGGALSMPTYGAFEWAPFAVAWCGAVVVIVGLFVLPWEVRYDRERN